MRKKTDRTDRHPGRRQTLTSAALLVVMAWMAVACGDSTDEGGGVISRPSEDTTSDGGQDTTSDGGEDREEEDDDEAGEDDGDTPPPTGISRGADDDDADDGGADGDEPTDEEFDEALDEAVEKLTVEDSKVAANDAVELRSCLADDDRSGVRSLVAEIAEKGGRDLTQESAELAVDCGNSRAQLETTFSNDGEVDLQAESIDCLVDFVDDPDIKSKFVEDLQNDTATNLVQSDPAIGNAFVDCLTNDDVVAVLDGTELTAGPAQARCFLKGAFALSEDDDTYQADSVRVAAQCELLGVLLATQFAAQGFEIDEEGTQCLNDNGVAATAGEASPDSDQLTFELFAECRLWGEFLASQFASEGLEVSAAEIACIDDAAQQPGATTDSLTETAAVCIPR